MSVSVAGTRWAISIVLIATTLARAEAGQPRSMREYLVSLEAQLANDQPVAEVKQALADCQVIEDDKNGWIQVMRPGGSVETVVQWTSETGSRVFGHVVDAPGDPEAEEPLTFWSYSIGTGRWMLQENLLPKLDLRDFWNESKPPRDERFLPVALRYVLPRKGTTIQAILSGPYDVETAFYLSRLPTQGELEAHVAAAQAATFKTLDLLWNREAGRFSKGKRQP